MLWQATLTPLSLDTRYFSSSNADHVHDVPLTPVFGEDSTVNRSKKAGKDVGEWMPPINRCWIASWVTLVKKKYGLTVDRKEVAALKAVLDSYGIGNNR